MIVLVAVIVTGTGYAFGQEEEPGFAFSDFQLAVIGIGVLAGFVTAYNGYTKAKRESNETFDITKFLDRVFMAVLGSIPLAIAESANIVVFDLFGAWIIFVSSLGTAEFIMEVRARANKGK